MRSRRFAIGSLLGIVTLVVEKGSSFLLVVLLARTLSAEAYGIYSFVIAYLTIFQVLADFGLEPVLVRRLSEPGSPRQRILAAGLGLRLGLALASVTLAVILAPWASGEGTEIIPVVLLGSAALLFLAQPGFRAFFRAELRLGRVFVVASATSLLTLTAIAWVVINGAGLEAILLTYAVAVWLGLLLAAVLAYPGFRPRLRFELSLWRDLLSECWSVGLSLFVLMIGLRAAAVVLMRVAGPVDVGLYSSAARLAEATNLIADGLLLLIFPILARFGRGRSESAISLARLTTRGLAPALCFVALVAGAWAEPLMTTIYGVSFGRAALPLAILLWTAPLAAVGSLYANLLVVAGRQRVLLAVNGGVAILMILLQLLLVPRFGLEGAAVGVVVGSLSGQLVLAFLASTRRWILPCLRAMLPSVALALALLTVVSLFADGSLAALWLAVAYPVLLFATGTVSRRDFALLRQFLADSNTGDES